MYFDVFLVYSDVFLSIFMYFYVFWCISVYVDVFSVYFCVFFYVFWCISVYFDVFLCILVYLGVRRSKLLRAANARTPSPTPP